MRIHKKIGFAAGLLIGMMQATAVPVIAHADGAPKSISAYFSPGYQTPDNIHALKADALRLINHAPQTLYGETDLGCIAVAVYHESRGQPIEGQKAVASVVMQRALVPNRWGSTACAVVRPVQFSFMTSRYRFPAIKDQKAWDLAVRVALTMLIQGPMPLLKGADHYHATYVHPRWRKSMVKVAKIGDHIFYRDPETMDYVNGLRTAQNN